MPSKKPVVIVDNVSKKFGKFTALENISLSINENEVFGLLGPNGAGKSTLTKILTGLVEFNNGRIEFFGSDMRQSYNQIKKFTAVVPQELSFYYSFTVRQNLDFFGMLYGLKGETLNQRIELMLEWLKLKGFENKKAEHLSGGYQRLLNIACSLMHDPEIIFFDEPTVGLDPKMRQLFWDKIDELKEDGKTICLTTHYMDEAEQLCDTVGIINEGKLLVCESPKSLIEKYGGFKILIAVLNRAPEESFVEALKKLLVGNEITSFGNTLVIGLLQEHAMEKISIITDWINGKGYDIKSSTLKEPELEDVFINLTGRKLKE